VLGRLRSLPIALLLGALVVGAGAFPIGAVGTGQQGCTPGYWKNHTSNWEEYAPNGSVGTPGTAGYKPGTVGAVFNSTAGAPVPYASWTLLQALQGGGGSGVDGAAKILLRAAVAAVLNAAHDSVGYPLQRSAGDFGGNGFVDDVVAALKSGDRNRMLNLASTLDRLNNLGCPLN
jgi:hypothetical protein